MTQLTYVSNEALEDLLRVWKRAGSFGPRAAFRHYYNVPTGEELVTEKVEDFAIAFMTQINRIYPGTF